MASKKTAKKTLAKKTTKKKALPKTVSHPVKVGGVDIHFPGA